MSITGYTAAVVGDLDPRNQFVWVKWVDAQTAMDAAVAAAVKSAVDDGFVLGKEAARDAMEGFHRGSCRWYYTERKCSCGLHAAIDALAPKEKTP